MPLSIVPLLASIVPRNRKKLLFISNVALLSTVRLCEPRMVSLVTFVPVAIVTSSPTLGMHVQSHVVVAPQNPVAILFAVPTRVD